MKMCIGSGDHTITCNLEAGKNLIVRNATHSSISDDVVSYAACRFIRHSGSLRSAYVLKSYRMRLASGKARKPEPFCFVAPAALMELPAAWVTVCGVVTPEGVKVERIGLFRSFDDARFPAFCRSKRVPVRTRRH